MAYYAVRDGGLARAFHRSRKSDGPRARAAGLIQTQQKKLVITDWKGLQSAAEFDPAYLRLRLDSITAGEHKTNGSRPSVNARNGLAMGHMQGQRCSDQPGPPSSLIEITVSRLSPFLKQSRAISPRCECLGCSLLQVREVGTRFIGQFLAGMPQVKEVVNHPGWLSPPGIRHQHRILLEAQKSLFDLASV